MQLSDFLLMRARKVLRKNTSEKSRSKGHNLPVVLNTYCPAKIPTLPAKQKLQESIRIVRHNSSKPI